MNFFKVIFLLFSIWIIGFAFFIEQIATKETVISQKSDAIIVLTGARGRIDAGLQLLQEKIADHLFISGVGYKVVLEDLSKYLVSFPRVQATNLKSAITLGHFANSTEENALESLAWIEKNHCKKIILVTSNYHMPRSLYLFKKLMPNLSITPYSTVSEGKLTFKLVFSEYNKFLLALIKMNKFF